VGVSLIRQYFIVGHMRNKSNSNKTTLHKI